MKNGGYILDHFFGTHAKGSCQQQALEEHLMWLSGHMGQLVHHC